MNLLSCPPGGAPPDQFSALGLAYIGDAVYELFARRYALELGEARVSRLHARGVELCRASAQSRAARVIADRLSDEEAAVFRRGRNAKPHSTPKNAEPQDYALATALEALFGWLYLSGRGTRLDELWRAVLECFEEETQNA